VLPPTPLQPDTRHAFRVDPAGRGPATHVRLEIHPDGGLARLRLFGELTAEGRAALGLRWFDRLPADHALAVLASECGLTGAPADELAARRPCERPARLNALLAGGEIPGLGGAADRVRALILGG
jgi:allantoicase